MNIAICDDNETDLNLLKNLIKEYSSSYELNLKCFFSARDLYDSHIMNHFDIILLDIEMPAPNGYEIAKKLILTKPKPLIIFITNSMEYTIRGYGIAYRYLTKPVSSDELNNIMDLALSEASANRFVFSIDGTSHIIPYIDIYYFEVYKHYTILHTIDSEYKFRETLKNIVIELPCGYFSVSHQSYLINFAHIKSFTNTDIYLTNGIILPLSRRKADEFKKMFYKFLGR